jgi:hypothetical protein
MRDQIARLPSRVSRLSGRCYTEEEKSKKSASRGPLEAEHASGMSDGETQPAHDLCA